MGESGLARGSIGTAHIVFFVVAAAAPLTAVVGASTAAFAFGDGAGVPAVFLLVGAFYLLFSAGFTAMSRFVASSSGFYAYVVRGLGRPLGVATAGLALTAYQAIAVAACGLFGFFASAAANSELHLTLPWWAAALALVFIVHLCGRRAIAFTGNLLAICMTGEVLILLALGCAILWKDGFGLAPLAPVFALAGPGLGVALVFVVASFIGFEATVIFGDEAREPRRTIPRATYVAVSLIALFYAFSTWTMVIHVGAGRVAALALANPAEFYLGAISQMLGPAVRDVANVLLLTSIFACVLSFHATVSRYLASVAREGLCHARLASIHPRHRSPHVAGLAQTLASAVIIVGCGLWGVDPYAGLFAWAGALASLGVLLIQFLTSLAVVGFFRHEPRGVDGFHRLIAPSLSAVGLFVALTLSVITLPLLSGSTSPLVFVLPGALIAVLVGGVLIAVRMRSRRPELYRALGA